MPEKRNPEMEALIESTRWTLINRLKDLGDEKSWKEFFETYWKLIYNVARKSGLTDAEAQDVVQEAVIYVSKKIKDFTADPAAGSFKSWLLTLTRWRIVDQVRKRPREDLAGFHRSEDTSSTPTAERIPDPAGLALDEVWNEEWRETLIENALKRVQREVSADHYQVFYLYAIRNRPPDQIATAHGIRVDQVYLIKHRVSKLFDEAVRELEQHPVEGAQNRR